MRAQQARRVPLQPSLAASQHQAPAPRQARHPRRHPQTIQWQLACPTAWFTMQGGKYWLGERSFSEQTTGHGARPSAVLKAGWISRTSRAPYLGPVGSRATEQHSQAGQGRHLRDSHGRPTASEITAEHSNTFDGPQAQACTAQQWSERTSLPASASPSPPCSIIAAQQPQPSNRNSC